MLRLLISIIFCTTVHLIPTHCYSDNEPNPSLYIPLLLKTEEHPKFVKYNYIDLDSIEYISKFRSCVGHDYSFGSGEEYCRSMKHYYKMFNIVDWSKVEIRSPVIGQIVDIYPEWAGDKITIKSEEHPAYLFVIFHVNRESPITVGTRVLANQVIGKHIGSQTQSDIAVMKIIKSNMSETLQLVSFFSIMSDSLFNTYIYRGAETISDFILSQEERDASPCTCSSEEHGSFITTGDLEHYFILAP